MSESSENATDPREIADESGLRDNVESVDELWEDVGFHKPMAGFWYSLLLTLLNLVLGFIMSGVFLRYVYPWPEAAGYRDTALSLFVLFFMVFDLGTHLTMERFIAEARIKDQQRMIQLIQYFIWYQMVTGLIQTTTLSVYALFIVPEGELAYAVWLMLLASITQYPGFLGVFTGLMKALQHYDKAAILGFVQSEIFQRLTEVGFLFIGRWYGAQNPAVGELMGIAMGSAVGKLIDDFLGAWLGAHYFSKLMRSDGFSARECFFPHFSWKVIKEPLVFGIKTGLPSLVSGFSSVVILWLYVLYIPQYASFLTLAGMAGTIMWVMASASPFLTPLYSEAYMNEKKELTTYYIGQGWRYAGQCLGLLVSIFSVIILILPDAFVALKIEYYFLMIPFILPTMLSRYLSPFFEQADQILSGTNHPNFMFGVRIFEEILKILTLFLLVVWLALPRYFGISAIIWILPCGTLGATFVKTVLSYLYIHLKVVPVKIPLWQVFGAPWTATGITFGLGVLVKYFIYDPIFQAAGFLIALIPFILFLFTLGFFVYFPLTGILGGWDDESLEYFNKAAVMSGPSKFLVIPMNKAVRKACEVSPLHNRFRVDASAATKEAQELIFLKQEKKK